MNMPIIPDKYKEGEIKNHFPIVVQLGILALIMFGVFGTLWLTGDSKQQASADKPYQTVPLYTATAVNQLSNSNVEAVNIRAKAAYVWDVKGERALFKKNETAVLPLASITKLMTALLAYELMPVQESVNVPLAAILQEGNSGLIAGDRLSIKKLNELALISSSNDAAYALAASVGNLLGEQDAANQFVSGMNIRADELGLSSLEFKNMTGLDLSATEPGAIGTARDVSFLMEYIIERYPEILAPTSEVTKRIYTNSGVYYDISNTNPVVSQIPNLLGSKTGYTDLAGGNLTVAFDLGHDRPIIITVLGSTRDERFSDVLTLIKAIQNSVTTDTYE